MRVLQPLVSDVVSHHLPVTYHGPNRPSDSNVGISPSYFVNITCSCSTSLVIGRLRHFYAHTTSKFHRQKLSLAVDDRFHPEDLTEVNHLRCFFRNEGCIICDRFRQVKVTTSRNMLFHVQSTSHILTLYLKSIAMNLNCTDPYSIEVQCPFMCPYRTSLLNMHPHKQSFKHSGQYTSIYCNILRFIRPELLMFGNPSYPLNDLLKLMIPRRLFGDRMFSIDDVCDADGRQLPLDILHPTFKTGKGCSLHESVF